MKTFNTQNVADSAGIHKTTLIRWLKQGLVPEPRRDARGWRKFDEVEAEKVKLFALGNQDFVAGYDSVALTVLKKLDWSFAKAKTNDVTP
ncbi:MerR family transcriptional regulator [Parasphingorhabdus sp.]|uniref:MerR family transcriptional regulator n=1 Tax=Parasphingorhabdus sp. TaxID=2709688 RepID=UPI00300132D9